MPRFDRDMHVIGAVVAVDAVLANQGLRQIECLDGQIEQAPRVERADLGGERLLARRQAEDGLPAAAPGGAVTDEASLQQCHPIAAFREVQRRRAAGDAAAEDGHVGLELALERLARELACAVHRGGVIGGGGRIIEVHLTTRAILGV